MLKCGLFLIPADLEALMRSLNIGPEEEDEHDHHMDEHADHDHSGLRLRRRSSHVHHMGHERNTTWDQVCKYRLKNKKSNKKQKCLTVDTRLAGKGCVHYSDLGC